MGDMAKPYPDRPLPDGARERSRPMTSRRSCCGSAGGISGFVDREPLRLGPKGPHRSCRSSATGAPSPSTRSASTRCSSSPARALPPTQGFRTILAGPAHKPYDKFIPAPGHGLGFNDLKVIECRELMSAIDGEPAMILDFNDGLAIERTVHAAAASAAKGCWVTVKHRRPGGPSHPRARGSWAATCSACVLFARTRLTFADLQQIYRQAPQGARSPGNGGFGGTNPTRRGAAAQTLGGCDVSPIDACCDRYRPAMTGFAGAVEVSISCGAVGLELQFCQAGADAWAKKTGNTVKVVSTPNDTNERLALYQQLLSAGSSDIDVFQIDVIWPGILGNHFIDLAPFTKGAEKDHFPAIVANNTIDGKLVAMPWFTDAGVLYYRTDLLEKYGVKPPATWQELTDAAAKDPGRRAQGGQRQVLGLCLPGQGL